MLHVLSARPRRVALLALLAALAVYNANFQRIASGDTAAASLLPFSRLLDGSLALDRFYPYVLGRLPQHARGFQIKDGHAYSGYPIGAPLLAAPLYIPLAAAAPLLAYNLYVVGGRAAATAAVSPAIPGRGWQACCSAQPGVYLCTPRQLSSPSPASCSGPRAAGAGVHPCF